LSFEFEFLIEKITFLCRGDGMGAIVISIILNLPKVFNDKETMIPKVQ